MSKIDTRTMDSRWVGDGNFFRKGNTGLRKNFGIEGLQDALFHSVS